MAENNRYFTAALLAVVFFFLGAATWTVAQKLSDTPLPASVAQGEHDPAVWGKVYSLQYQSSLKNLETTPSPTGFGGSVNYQHSTKEPEILINFKGMGFSKDYSEDRGHPYALEDLKTSKRFSPKSPGSCMTCKTADMVDIFKESGWSYAAKPVSELLPRVKHSITCANCHDPQTMKLRIVNQAFTEAMARRGVDVSKATRDQMRSWVCAQCHSEYFLEPGTNKVVLPFDKGLHPEEMYGYYEGKPSGFLQDWIHPDSQARMLKVQHPDFETWSKGIHGMSGVSCADCHLPSMYEGGKKYSSHWITSPMKHVKASCLPCHDQKEEWFLTQVTTIQKSVFQLQRLAGTTIAQAHEAIGRAASSGKAKSEELAQARELIRKAQWYWDFVAAENSTGFHNSTQAANVLGQSIDLAHRAIQVAEKKCD